jgi:hypothetical protein
VDPRAGLHEVEKSKFLTLSGLELRPLDRPGRSQFLYRLRYPGRVKYRIIVNSVQCDSICRYLLPLHISVS